MKQWNCANCNVYVNESHPHFINDQVALCWSCSFIENKIDEKTFLQYCGIYLPNTRAAVNQDNEIEIVVGTEKFSWQKLDKDYRGTKEYTDWRKSVFGRDNYTCQKCNVRGGLLEAHHIKPFKDYFDLRYEQTNGITLCKKCHKETHKEMRNVN